MILSDVVLIVSRDADLPEVARRAFRARSVAPVSSPRAALAKARAGAFTLILDIDLAPFPARAFLRALEEQAPGTSVFLAAGGKGLARAAALARELGYEVVAKPALAPHLRRAANVARKRRAAEAESRAFVERLTESNRLLAETQTRMRQRILSITQELLALQELNDRMFQSLASGLLVLDREGRVTRINAAAREMLAIDDARSIGRTAHDVFRARGAAPLDAALGADGKGGGGDALDEEVIVLAHDQREVCVHLRASRLRDESGATIGLVAIFNDITRLKRQDQELRRIERLASLGELSAGMAHEIRNPLASIGLTAEFLMTQMPEDNPDRKLLGLVIDEVSRVNQLIEDLLKFARPAAPQFSAQSIPALIDKCVTLLSRKASAKRLSIARAYAQDLPTVDLDPAQMTQVFLNVLLNAIEASPASATITLSASLATPGSAAKGDAAHAVSIVVEDCGSGIDPANAEKIWNPFFSTKAEGTGLGLSICQRIVAEHRGRITITNRAQAGARVVIELPVPLYGEESMPAQQAIEILSKIYS